MIFRVQLTGLFLAFFAVPVMAEGPYVTLSGGVSLFDDQDITGASGATSKAVSKTGYGINAGIGYDFNAIRLEFEYGYKQADVDKFTANGLSASGSGSDSTMKSYMINTYYDFTNKYSFSPYIGVGVGLINGNFTSPGFDSGTTVFGYQFIVGSAYKVTPRFAVDLAYRYQGASKDFAIEGGSHVSYDSNNIVIGLRYNF